MPRKLLQKLFILCIWLGIWAVAAKAVGHTLLLPSPLETLRALTSQVQRASFWLAVAHSMRRIVLGYCTGILLGTLLAVCTSRFAWCNAFFAPFLSTIKATPVASFIMLALVWLRTDSVPIFATVLIVLPACWANVHEGIGSTDAGLLEMATAFRLPWYKKVQAVYWPTVRPYFRAAATTGMGMAWKAGVAAEVIATPRMSLGSSLYDAKVYLDTPALFATTAIIILLSILLETAVAWAARRGGKKNA